MTVLVTDVNYTFYSCPSPTIGFKLVAVGTNVLYDFTCGNLQGRGHVRFNTFLLFFKHSQSGKKKILS